MPFNLSSILKQARDVKADEFIYLLETVTELLCNENGQIGNLNITGRLVTLAPEGEALIIGDLHGNLTSLTTIMNNSSFLSKLNAGNEAVIVFLGDYGDRGTNQVELYYTILSLKAAFPEQVVLLRGNHEGPIDLMVSPHDLPQQLQRKFKNKGVFAYDQLVTLFGCLYNVAYVENQYLMVHGGLPASVCNLQEIAQADKLHPDMPFLEELLWNDPDEIVQDFVPSPRGAGELFGKAITDKVLARLNVKILIRSHEPAPDGYKINHSGKILTVFSRKGPPYYNNHGAYLNMPLNKKFKTANSLIPYIHKF